MQIAQVKEELFLLADKSGHIAQFSGSLNPTSSEMIGVRVPDLRTLAKKIAKDDYKQFLEQNPQDSFEMQMLEGLVLGYAKDEPKTILGYAKKFIPLIHDWAVNDAFCQTFKLAQKEQSLCWDFFMHYAKSKKEFEVRVVAVMLMTHFFNDQYIDRSLGILNSLYTGKTDDKSDFYYAKMGVAWAVASAAASYPQKCLEFMQSEQNNLDRWTFNKSIQKMCESFRVSDHVKQKMKSLKIETK